MPTSTRYVYLCPICEHEMIRTGFCHLECPSGHYQEVCSDLFQPERVDSKMPNEKPSSKPKETVTKTS